MIRLFHASDLHLHADPAKNVAAARLLATIHERHFEDPGAHLLVTGDITDDGTGEQYAQASELLHPFADRLLACPGNHDAGRLGNIFEADALARFHEAIDSLTVTGQDSTRKRPVETVLEHAGTKVVCLGLDSTRHTANPLDFARGEVGESQRDALYTLLNRAELMDLPTVVYLHHKPLRIDGIDRPVMELVDAAELMEIVASRCQVVCFGHSGGSEQSAQTYGSSTGLVRSTFFIDANRCVRDQAYFEIVFDGTKPPRVSLLEV